MSNPTDASRTFTALGVGRWFPSDPERLRAMVTEYMEATPSVRCEGDTVAAIAPHAGYTYSGPVAGYVYRCLRDAFAPSSVPRTVVVLGASHRLSYPGLAIMDADRIATPLGAAAIDNEVCDNLVRLVPGAVRDNRPHRGEHSVENQVPFLQAALPSARLVPGLFGDHDLKYVEALADALNDLCPMRHLTVIASTDLLHHPDYDMVSRTDRETLDILASMDESLLSERWRLDHQPVCGLMPVLAAMRFARKRGVRRGSVLGYRNSGDDFPESRGEWVVGYGAVVFNATSAES